MWWEFSRLILIVCGMRLTFIVLNGDISCSPEVPWDLRGCHRPDRRLRSTNFRGKERGLGVVNDIGGNMERRALCRPKMMTDVTRKQSMSAVKRGINNHKLPTLPQILTSSMCGAYIQGLESSNIDLLSYFLFSSLFSAQRLSIRVLSTRFSDIHNLIFSKSRHL